MKIGDGLIRDIRGYWDAIWRKIHSLSTLVQAVQLVWRSSRLWTLTGIVLMVLQGMLPLAGLYLIKRFFDLFTLVVSDAGVSAQLFEQALLLVGLAAVVSVGEAGLRSFASVVEKHQTEEVKAYIIDVLHDKSIEADIAYYENADFFNTLHRAQQEAPYRPVSIVRGLLGLGQNGMVLTALGGLFVMFDWVLVLVLAGSVLPGFLVRLVFSEKLYRQQERQTERERRMDYMNWLLTGEGYAKEIRLLGTGMFFKQRYSELQAGLRDEDIALAVSRSRVELAAQLPAVAAVYGMLAYIAGKAFSGLVSIGSVVMYYQAFQRGQSALTGFFGSLASLYEDTLFLSGFYRFLDLQPVVREPECPVSFPDVLESGISVERVSFCYPGSERKVFDELTFSIAAGEHVAIVGENGAGKTTLVKLLCRLYDPDSGCITIDGTDLRRFGLSGLRRNLAVLFQDFAKYQATLRDNIGFGNIELRESDERIYEAARLAGVDGFVKKLPEGYATLLGKLFDEGVELSIGQWQKVALARTYIRSAPIILLDEPSSALDVQSEHDLVARFSELARGRTTILISHRLSTVKMADRILVIDRGRVAESGSHEELLERRGIYARLYMMQAGNYR